MKRALLLLLLLLAVGLTLLSCGSSYSAPATTTGGTNRAFISEDVSAGSISAAVYILNAKTDVLAGVSPISAGNTPGMMLLTPNRTMTLVFSPAGNQLTLIDNAKESTVGQVTLPGFTESFVVSPDSSTAYAAVPTASVVGQSPGAVKVIALSTAAFTGQVDIPSVRYLAINNTGNRILAFRDSPDSTDPPCTTLVPCFLSVITPSNIGTQTDPVVRVPGFDHPVAAFFSSDDTTAYVVNCGAECGGSQASVQKLDLTTNRPGAAISVPAASVAIVNGTTMYLAGTPFASVGGTLAPTLLCSVGQTTTQAQYCGRLSIFDLASMSVVDPTTTIVITDGYHNRMALGANGQVFVGGRTCTEIAAVNPGDEVRGCLSVYNTLSTAVGSVPPGGVLIPSANGDVTGLQPIAKRTAVYVVQGGSLRIYDARIDALEDNPNNPNNPGQIANLAGQFVDVKTPDF
ncbi:MAG: hypothetical protein LAO56_04470 [Acidobacteriia bacterium]|nr:hypothetical protein [Terriglobia bacterium]